MKYLKDRYGDASALAQTGKQTERKKEDER
jgi:hypothetical protein